jgi:hypothetical protein
VDGTENKKQTVIGTQKAKEECQLIPILITINVTTLRATVPRAGALLRRTYPLSCAQEAWTWAAVTSYLQLHQGPTHLSRDARLMEPCQIVDRPGKGCMSPTPNYVLIESALEIRQSTTNKLDGNRWTSTPRR